MKIICKTRLYIYHIQYLFSFSNCSSELVIGLIIFSDFSFPPVLHNWWDKSHGMCCKGPHGLFFPISSYGSFLYVPSHRQDSTYPDLCYTSCGVLAEMRNSLMGPPWGIDLTTYQTISGHTTRSISGFGCCFFVPFFSLLVIEGYFLLSSF